jgi:hypothetical protein
MRLSTALRLHRLRALTTIVGTIVVVAGLGIVSTASPASATSGGGCWTTSVSWFDVTGCISAQRNVVYPDGYVSWRTIPPGCSVALFLQNSSGQNVARYNYPCGYYHYGPFSWSVPCLTNWRSDLVVYNNNTGPVSEVSPFVFVDPGPGGGC